MIGNGDQTIRNSVTKVFSAANTTDHVNLFQLTGSVRVKKLGAVLTAKTTLANMTDCGWGLYDSTSEVAITKLTTLTLSTAVVGAVIGKVAAATVNAGFASAAVGVVTEGSTPFLDYQWAATQKNGANTYIRFNYTTTDNPIACTWKFFVEYESINGGMLTAV